MADRFHYFMVTGGGLGLAPVASGTFGSLGGVAIAMALELAFMDTELAIALGVTALVLLVYGCTLSAFNARTFKNDDPKPFVLDEIVGYLVAMAIFVAFRSTPELPAHMVCFVLFRFFDVTKIWPANALERMHGAPGVMLDDVAAGVYAGVSLHLLLCLFP